MGVSFEQQRKEVVQYLIRNKVLVTGDLLQHLGTQELVLHAHQHVIGGTAVDSIVQYITSKGQTTLPTLPSVTALPTLSSLPTSPLVPTPPTLPISQNRPDHSIPSPSTTSFQNTSQHISQNTYQNISPQNSQYTSSNTFQNTPMNMSTNTSSVTSQTATTVVVTAPTVLATPQKQQQSGQQTSSRQPNTSTESSTTPSPLRSNLSNSSAGPIKTSVTVVQEYLQKPQKISLQHFVGYFNARYKAIESMLRQRMELKNCMSVGRLSTLKEKQVVALIGLVYEKRETKNGNLVVVLEDPTGTVTVIFHKNNKDAFAVAQDLVMDEVIGITGQFDDKVIFGQTIIHPDIPLGRELKKSPDEVYAAFISDMHVGSKLFTEKSFSHFIDWISGKTGNEKQREIAKKTKYLFIVGDLVDSIGVYPNQENELNITDIYGQFEKIASYLRQVPLDVHMIICPGNHEPLRIAEPQPRIDKDFGKVIWDLPNATLITNPAIVNIHSSTQFPGFDVLLYHGFSYTFYGDQVHSIRNSGKNVSERIELVMKFVLQRRHLAPQYGSNQFVPELLQDPLVITKVPDFFCSGHIHKSSISTYRGVTLISGSCFQKKSSYQEKFGHEPDPGKVPLVNLKTRENSVLNFEVEE